MGKASSSKKVQRAAKAAAASRGTGESRERGFPILVGVIIVLGIGLVFAARGSRAEAVVPFIDDHWHSAYEVYDCGTLVPAIQNTVDPDGIHTHGNGLIHIHPFNSSATGEDAALRVFFDATGLEVNETTISSGEFATIDATTGCGDADSVIKLGRWNVDFDGAELEEVITSGFSDVRFLHANEAFTFAKVAADEDPPPPSPTVLARLSVDLDSTNRAPESEGDDANHTHEEGVEDDHEHDDAPASDDESPDDEAPEDDADDEGEAEPDSE